MSDARRKRRYSKQETKRRWYASWRAVRFARRFGGLAEPVAGERTAGTSSKLRQNVAFVEISRSREPVRTSEAAAPGASRTAAAIS